MIEPEFLKIAEAKGLTLSEEKLGIAVLRGNEQIRFCFNKEKLQAFLKSYGAKESEKELNSSHEVQQMNKSSSDSSEIQIEPDQPLMKEGIQAISANEFKKMVLENAIPTVVHFSLNSEFDTKMQPLLESAAESLSGRAAFTTVNISENTNLCEKHGVSIAPTLLFFVRSKVVGYTIGVQPAEDLKLKISSIVEKQDGDHKEISPEEIKKASKAVPTSGEWSNAFVSGLVAGLVFLFVRTKLEGAATLIVPGLAMAFFITNSNFRFSYVQKAFAIVLMLVIGTYGLDIAKFLLAP